jgi:hypothetical protein
MKFLLLGFLMLASAASSSFAQSSRLMREFPRFPGHSIQGMAITESGLLIQGYNFGQCRIFDLNRESNEPIAEFPLGSAGKGNHANAVSISRTHHRGNEIPLLYITGGQPADGIMECHVENIVKTDAGYRAEQVQRITLAPEFQWGMDAAVGYQTADGFQRIWGAPSFLVDADAGCLWVFSARYRTTKPYLKHKEENRYIATKLRLPAVGEGDVMLTRQDVLDQIVYEFDALATQSGCVKDGKLYYTFGFGRDRASMESSQLRVFDFKHRYLTLRADFAETIPEEFESCAFYRDEFYAMTQEGRLYRIAL